MTCFYTVDNEETKYDIQTASGRLWVVIVHHQWWSPEFDCNCLSLVVDVTVSGDCMHLVAIVYHQWL